MMKLVEVVRTPNTSDETFDALMEFSKTIKKTPVACKVLNTQDASFSAWLMAMHRTYPCWLVKFISITKVGMMLVCCARVHLEGQL